MEHLTTGLILGLLSVSAGIYVTNYKKNRSLRTLKTLYWGKKSP
jgi:hypothetical protein